MYAILHKVLLIFSRWANKQVPDPAITKYNVALWHENKEGEELEELPDPTCPSYQNIIETTADDLACSEARRVDALRKMSAS